MVGGVTVNGIVAAFTLMLATTELILQDMGCPG
jgi:hypothetical protein